MSYRVAGLKELQQSFSALGAATSRAEARAVVQRVNLKVSRVKEAVRVAQKATPDRPQIIIEARRTRAIGLIEFGGTWRGLKSAGASALVLREEGRHTYAGTFIAAGLGNNRQIFDRKRSAPKQLVKSGRNAGKMKQPLKTLYGPSVYSQFLRDDIQKVGVDTWALRLPIELDRETQFALKQAGF